MRTTAGADGQSWRLLSVVDTRDFIEIDDKFVPIPGSGSMRPCDRCGRSHEIHATMEDSAGKVYVVGIGCAKQTSPELDDALKAGQSAATTLAKNEAEVAALRERLATELKVQDEVSRLPDPKSVSVERNGKQWLQTEDGKATVLLQPWVSESEARHSVASAWRDRVVQERLVGMGWKNWYAGSTATKLQDAEKRLKRSQKKIGAKIASGGTYWRAHDPARPFSKDDAISVPLSDRQSYYDDLRLSPWYRPGYSAMENPWHLWAYFVVMGWYADRYVQGDQIVEFSGRPVTRSDFDAAMGDMIDARSREGWDRNGGRGFDGEAVVVPDMRKVRRMSWDEFEQTLLRTPMPPDTGDWRNFHLKSWRA